MGRGSSGLSASGKPSGGSGSGNEDVSSVKSKHTSMSAGDVAIVDNGKRPPEGGYFQTSESWKINSNLRSGQALTERQQKIVDAMDRNMKPLDSDITVRRAVDDSYLSALGIDTSGDVNITSLRSALVGAKITEKGFVSTSYDFSKNVFKSRNVHLNMTVKKGTKAMFSPTGKEGEMVLARGTKYVIKGITEKDDGWGDTMFVIDVETIV